MGRKPIGVKAMTGSERTLLWRQRKRAAAPPKPATKLSKADREDLAAGIRREIERDFDKRVQEEVERRLATAASAPSVEKATERSFEKRVQREVEQRIAAMLTRYAQGRDEPISDPAVRKIQKRMDAEYEMHVRAGIRAQVAEHIMPMYAEKLALADRIIAGKKPLSIEEYRKLLGALHPDSSSVERRTEMFLIVKERELLLRPAEKDKPLSGDLPKTVEELLARRQATTAKRKAKGKSNSVNASG